MSTVTSARCGDIALGLGIFLLSNVLSSNNLHYCKLDQLDHQLAIQGVRRCVMCVSTDHAGMCEGWHSGMFHESG